MKINRNHIFLGLIILLLAGSTLFLYLQVRTDRITEDVSRGRIITLLLAVEGEETPLLISEVFVYNPDTARGAIIDVPAHTGAIIRDLDRVDRIDALYRQEGVEAYMDQLESLLGEPVKYYMVTDKQGLEEIVDLVEGLDLFIANPVEILSENYDPVLLPSGSVVLDGSKSVDYISYRLPGEETGERASRNHKMFQALIESWGDAHEQLVRREVFPYLKERLRTNMTDRSLASFLEELSRLDDDRIVFQRVLGVERMVEGEQLLFPHYEGNLVKQTVDQVYQTIAHRVYQADDGKKVTVEILNGSLVNGLAGRTAELLRGFGYDIGSIRNADRSDYDYTVVLDRQGNREKAQQLADILRCERVYNQPDEAVDESIDITLILGRDFDGRYCKD